MENYLKRTMTLILALLMLMLVPLQTFAEINGAGSNENNSKQKGINYDETPIVKERYINKAELPVIPAKADKPAKEYVANPKEPKLYNIKFDYKVQRGDDQIIAYQPYIATVGENATEADKKKMERNLKFPILDGYTSPTKEANLSYDYIVKHSKKTPETVWNSGYRAQFYKPKDGNIKVKHVFQDFENPSEYGKLPGHDEDIITEQTGVTGTSLKIQPIPEKDRVGYVPESNDISTQVPENIEDFEVEYRYNRANFSVTFDTGEGTPIPARTLYYAQKIPKIDKTPTKIGSDFLGWKPSVDLNTEDGKTFKANEIIKVATGGAIKNLDANLIMPGSKVTFTAVWKDKERADYAIQFWAEKADHADDASLPDKYDYMGTHVHKDADTGFRPDLDAEPVKNVVFPDLDQARLQKIWAGEKFYGDKYLYLNKFFVYNKELTAERNADPKKPRLTKSVSPTGQTVYNIYYDRQVYDLYFTKSNKLPAENTFCPEIYVPDGDGGAKLAGGPGNLYHYKARFNQLMLGWPNDAMQTKGFSEGMQSYGWGPNYGYPQWPQHLDTPPYRLNADEFLDMPNYDNWGGYVSQIDKGDGTYIDVKNDPRYKAEPYKALSFGIKQADGSMPHHMDFWMDGFKDGETIIRYDLYRSKADTQDPGYGHKYSRVQGFTPYYYTEGGNWPTIVEANEKNGRVTGDDIDKLNEEREEKTPLPDKEYMNMFGFNTTVGQMNFISAFFNTSDDFGDPLDGVTPFKENGYIRFKYHRNKYPLRFNYDPSKIKGDNEFFYPDPNGTEEEKNKANALETFYEFPLKVLSPDLVPNDTPRKDRDYFKDNPANFLDKPENLQKLGLKDLVFTDPKDGKLKVKRPEGLSDQMVFKGWALDPAGTKLIWENPKETMPNHALNLYAKWGEPDYKWKVTFDPNGGKLPELYKDSDITTEEKTIEEGDIGQEEKRTYPTSKMDGDKRIATVIQRQKLREPEKPIRDGYEFLGWELVRFKKDPNGNDTKEVDDSYRNDYKVPELYSFGNDVVSDLYLKAIWVKTNLIEIKSYHHFLDLDYKEIKKPEEQNLKNKRVGSYVSAVGSRQNAQWILVPRQEFEDLLKKNEKYDDSSMTYKEYQNFDPNNKRTNSYNQQIRVEPEKITDTNGKEIDNPDAKYNVFHFFYRKFRQREYYVNYLDVRGKAEVENFIKETKKSYTESIKNNADLTEEEKAREYKQFLINQKKEFEKITKKYSIIDQEKVTNGNRHMDARNFRPIDGWVLDDKPQQQLFFDINENTNAFFGINETGLDEINFFYKDARVIEVKDKNDPIPDGYVRVTFVADKGGAFKDKDENSVTELYYDVVKGLKSDSLPVPKELEEGKEKEADKYYITPDNGKKFIKWDKQKLLNDNTIIEKDYTFTAQYDWSDVHAKSKGLVKTEAFNDPNNTWTNNFAPTIDELKAQIVKTDASGNEVALPSDATVTIVDDDGKELEQKDIYEKVKELGKLDTNELVRTVKFKAKVTFAGNQADKIVDIPVTIYKNVYEALTNGDMPKVLKDATTAPDGDLVDVTGEYVKVTVNPTNKPTDKDAKIYYVNPKAWVEIPEIKLTDKEKADLGFTNWTADVAAQNENGEKDGSYDFTKRHKFTKDTVISPGFAKDVVEQKEGEGKPKVPDNYVKVIVTTKEKDQGNGTFIEKATDGTAFEKTFWVNPSKEVTIDVENPTGKTETADLTAGTQAKAWIFEKWESNEAPARTWKDVIKAQFETETKISAKYKQSDNIIEYDPEEPITRPDGYVRVKFKADEGLTLSNVKFYYVKKNSGVKLSDLSHPTYEEKTGYKFKEWDKEDTTLVEAEDITVTAKATKLDSVIPAIGTNTKPEGYIEVTFKIKDEYANNGELKGVTKYFVKPKEYVKMNPPETKAKTGYEFGAWNEDTTIPTVYEQDTTIEASFNQLKSVYTEEKPGYVKVTFTIEGNGGIILSGQTREYYVDPNREVTLTPPTTKANTGYEFDFWDKDATQETKYETATTINGKFKKLPDIISSKNPTTNEDNAKPEGYVTVTFTKGDHGSAISGETIFYVNPTAKKTLGDITPKPTVIPDIGYAVNGWDKADAFAIKQDTTVNAKYDNFELVIPEKDANGNPNMIPLEYVKVTFDTNGKGTIKNSTETTKIVYVRPNTAVVLKGYEPEVTANSGYKFSGWSVDLSKATVYNSGDVIKAQYNNLGDIKTTEEPGFVKVEFHTGPEGTLLGDANLWVRPGVALTLPAPIVTPNAGHTFKDWDKPLNVTLPAGSSTYIINAQYDNAENIIPEIDASGKTNTKPDGYVTVTFRADDHGSLEGGKDVITYFVNPNAGIKLVELGDGQTASSTQLAVPKTVPDANYGFDKWYESLDTTNPIKVDREYVARFKSGRVTLTYKAGEGAGKVPEVVTVDYGTKVRLAPDTGLSKADAKFSGWMIDGKIYQVGDEVELKENTTATAQWTTDKDIISYDPKEPITRPEGYVRVSFEAENGLSLTGQKAYYVKANKGIKLEDARLTKPGTLAETGYKFDKWDQVDTTVINTDIVVTAKATKLETVIPEKDTNGNTNDKPEGYKEVTFVVKTGDESKGSLEGNTKFYVNPNEYVTINPPTAKAKTGYEFAAWSPDPSIPKVYTEDATIEASFNGLKDVIPKTKEDESEKPAGYVTVSFEIEGQGGKIVDGETITYFVKPNTDVTIQNPQTIAETGYKFDKWDTDTTKSRAYDVDTKVKGSFTKLEDIIDGNEAKPDGYVTLTFEKGDHGTEITGQRVYYVNPKADPAKTIGEITKPTVTPETGWKQKAAPEAWDKADTTQIKGPDNIVVKAQYEPIDDVILKTKEDESEKPDGYITVTFDTVDSGKGIIGSTIITKKVLFVNPNKSIVLIDKAPIVTTKKGYSFAGWDTSIDQAIQYKENTLIKALYNDPGNISTTEVSGYAKVEFKAGANGSLSGTTEYWIKPGVEVNIPAPTVKPNIGWKQDEVNPWDKSLRVTAKANDPTYVITAKYTERADVIPQVNTDGSDKPEGYVTVKLLGVHGSLEGTTIYYVNPNKEIWLLRDLPNNLVQDKNADIGYTAIGGKWSSDSTLDWASATRVKFSADTTIKYTFAPRKDVIERTKDDDSEKPKGYVTVKLIPTDKATAETNIEKIYFVNPTKEVTIPSTDPVGKEIKDANNNTYTFLFKGWTVTRGTITKSWDKGTAISGTFIQDTEITAKYNIKAENLVNAPIPKENLIYTASSRQLKAEELIANIPGQGENPLPQGTEFSFTDDGKPNLREPGQITAKVKVKYPNGKTVVVEVPITVVDHVVEQIGKKKPVVPEDYVKVIVDAGEEATDNTVFSRTFWVRKDRKVWIPVNIPTGSEKLVEGIKRTYIFNGWNSNDGNKHYDKEIRDVFTKDVTKIKAVYTIDSDVEAKAKNGQWIPQGSNPSPKDFIENPYDDNNPDKVDTLPPGTKFEFVGAKPDTSSQGKDKTTTIEITYPNGKTTEVTVTYNVTGDVVEQTDPNNKPPVPDNFVTVIVNTTDLATEDVTRTFRVNPEKVVDILVNKPDGKKVNKTQDSPEIQYVFKEWQSDEDPVRTWAESISGQFTAKVTTITAQYEENKGQPSIVDAGMYYTSESLKDSDGSFINNYLPTEEELKTLVKEKDSEVELVELDTNSFDDEIYDKLQEKPRDIKISRRETIKAKVTFKNGSKSVVEIPIVVYKNIYEGLTNGGKPDYVARAEKDLNTQYVRVTLIPTAKAKNQQRKTYYVRKNASVIIPEISAEGRDAYQFMYWEAETPGKGQDNPNYGWATRAMSMLRSAEPINKDDLVNNGKIIDKVDGNTRMSFDRDTDIVAQYKTPTPTPTPDEPDKPNPDYPNYPDYPEYRPNYSGGSTIYIEKPVEKVIKVPDNAYVKEVRYMQGYMGDFRPKDGLTRAEAAQILANALVEDGYKYNPNFKLSYKDIGEAWYTRAIKIVTEAKVFAGYDDGNFKPQDKITRNEWIATLKRFQELGDVSGNHMKLKDGHWAMAEIEAAFEEGWLNIYSDGLATYEGDKFIPREEVAAVSNKAFKRVLDKTYIRNNEKNLISYKDVKKDMWSYEDILCASNTFLYKKDLYRAHWIKEDNNEFNINTEGFEIVKAKFQRNPR